MTDTKPVDDAALNSIAGVTPDDSEGQGTRPMVGSADAGTDTSIEERLERNPGSKDARLDRALDESMDASDPPASTQPVHSNEPPASSGYDADAERKLAEAKNLG